MSDPLKVIVLEDNLDVAHWLKPALSFIGGMEAEILTRDFTKLETVDRWRGVGAVLTDWMIPGFDVHPLLVWMKANTPHVRRIIFTAAYPEDIKREAGDVADAIIYKGVGLDDIVKVLRGPIR